jgi:hypothetical protein
MTFRKFLKSRKVTDNPRGDFIFDACQDECLDAIQSKEQLVTYLRRKSVCSEAIKEARILWNAYEKRKVKL